MSEIASKTAIQSRHTEIFAFYLPRDSDNLHEECKMENQTLYGIEDSRVMNEDVGSWSAEKYGAFRLYAQIFSNTMKDKWKSLTYLDLYAGAGQSRVKSTGELLLGSPLIALSLDLQFHTYVLCEEDVEKLAALRARVNERFPQAKAIFVEGDCNDTVEQIRVALPRGSLTLCFVDPYRLNIRFDTIRALANDRNVDFLCLLASRMDAGRNPHNYTREESKEADLFLGSNAWREKWDAAKKEVAKSPNLGDFLCREFSKQMESLGYLPTEMHEMKAIKTDSGVVLYHLALFSKNAMAKKFWKQASVYSHSQREMF
jgi:three-Cys-motif partner protein